MLSPEMNQKITDLRQRIMRNIAEGRDSNAGIEVEEFRQVLDVIRSTRAPMGSKGGKVSAANKKAKVTNQSSAEAAASLREKLAARGINIDDC